MFWEWLDLWYKDGRWADWLDSGDHDTARYYNCANWRDRKKCSSGKKPVYEAEKSTYRVCDKLPEEKYDQNQ